MSFQFSAPAPFYDPASLFLGREGAYAVGIKTERHAITIAGAGMGKGVALIVPNLRRWPRNVLVIDPKGEALELTHKERRAMGQKVVALDPFHSADIPAELRGSFNPLGDIEPNGFMAREEIQVIADGLVKVHDPRHVEWVEGARDILAGIMAHIVETATPETKNLLTIRTILLNDDETLFSIARDMSESDACGGLGKAAGVTIITALESTKGMERDFLSGARRATKWLDSPPVAATLRSSSFALSELKTGKASVYLVLPPHLIETHAAYLRLFVRCAIFAMAQGGSGRGERCLFLLDEFFSLGRIDEIAKAAGLMRSYGVHLWPFLQDLGQLVQLYGQEGAETFFGNADAHIFFGNTDPLTLGHISGRIGRYGANEITTSRAMPLGSLPPRMPMSDKGAQLEQHFHEMEMHDFRRGMEIEAHFQNMMHDAEARKVGQPRLPPEVVKGMIGKGDGDTVARSMIVFGKGEGVYRFLLAPYFAPQPRTRVPDRPLAPEEIAREKRHADWKAAKQRKADDLKRYHERVAEARKKAVSFLQDAAAALCVGGLILHFGSGFVDWIGGAFALVGGVMLAGSGLAFHESEEIPKPIA